MRSTTLHEVPMPRPDRTRALEHDLADLRQDLEQQQVAFRSARARIYSLEAELRQLRNFVEDLLVDMERKRQA